MIGVTTCTDLTCRERLLQRSFISRSLRDSLRTLFFVLHKTDGMDLGSKLSLVFCLSLSPNRFIWTFVCESMLGAIGLTSALCFRPTAYRLKSQWRSYWRRLTHVFLHLQLKCYENSDLSQRLQWLCFSCMDDQIHQARIHYFLILPHHPSFDSFVSLCMWRSYFKSVPSLYLTIVPSQLWIVLFFLGLQLRVVDPGLNFHIHLNSTPMSRYRILLILIAVLNRLFEFEWLTSRSTYSYCWCARPKRL